MPNQNQVSATDVFSSEKIIIGACIRDTLCMYQILDRIGVEDLESHDMRCIYLCIKELVSLAQEVTLAKVASLYAQKAKFSANDCLLIVMSCYEEAFNFDADYHSEIVQNRAKLRRLRDLGFKLANLSLDKDNALEIIAGAKESISQLSLHSKVTISTPNESMNSFENGKSFEDVFKQRIEAANRGENSLPGIPYKIPKIDHMTGGIRAGSLVLIGGRTSAGKTQFVLNLVKNWLDMGVPVGMFSMEMPLFQIDARMIALKSGLDVDRVERPEKGMNSSDVMKVMHAAKWHRGVKFCYDASSGLTPTQVRARAYFMQQAHGTKIIVVDFLTLMKSEKKTVNSHEKFSDIIHELQTIAKDTNLSIVILAQLNRENAKAGNQCPSLHHIRESGAIEESVDVAMLIHRPDAQDHHNKPGEVHINLDKNRHTGNRGLIKLAFDKSSGRYYQCEDQKISPSTKTINEVEDNNFLNNQF